MGAATDGVAMYGKLRTVRGQSVPNTDLTVYLSENPFAATQQDSTAILKTTQN